MGRPFTPDYATAPGETLAEWLDEQEVSTAELAGRLGMSADALGRFLRGDMPLDEDLADALERATGIPARIWHGLEAYYQNDRTRLAATPPAR